jgi:hypothetical protein
MNDLTQSSQRQEAQRTQRREKQMKMAISSAVRVAAILVVAIFIADIPSTPEVNAPHAYLGLDRNDYPGDEAMKLLRKTFAFTSYWLSPPPGEKTNTWAGKRELLRSQGYGFLVLFRGRASSELKNEAEAKSKGIRDAEETIAATKAEYFPPGTVIFLDIEEGGRLPEPYHVYLATWSQALTNAGYHPGVYCSGIPVKEGPGVSITTADDIRKHDASREITMWVFNDVCPPSPGCTFPQNPPAPAGSGISYAAVWQFAQSPRRKERTAHCRAKYTPDGNCYAPSDTAHAWFLDVNTATSPDPSGGAK